MNKYISTLTFIIAMLFSMTAYGVDFTGEYEINHKDFGGGFDISKEKNGTYSIECGILVPIEAEDRAKCYGFNGENGKVRGNTIVFDVPYQKAKVEVNFSNLKRVTMKVIRGEIIWGPEYTYSKK